LTANGAKLGDIEKKLELNFDGQVVEINPQEDKIMINEDGINVESQELVVEGDKMKIGDVEIKMPSEIIKKDELGENVKKISVKEENGKAVYSIEREVERKLFGLIAVGVSEKQKLDAVNGEEIEVEKPWWGFMAR
ncbi:MAG TPA: hypothetical protein VJH95_03185, partial [Candidatus Nanoarchaeia archaeon]|nr:hypothetical protein [Candidatus Nanoarchaeia archaeon]